MTVIITLTTAGADTGPFLLYSDADGYISAFETGVTKAALEAGYTTSLVPDYTTIIRVVSEGICTNYVDLPVDLPNYCYTVNITGGGGQCTISWINPDGTEESKILDSKETTMTVCAEEGSVESLCIGGEVATIEGGVLLCSETGDCPTTTTTTTALADKMMCFVMYMRINDFPSGTCDVYTTVSCTAAGTYGLRYYYHLVFSGACGSGSANYDTYVFYDPTNMQWEWWQYFDPISGPSGLDFGYLPTSGTGVEILYPNSRGDFWVNNGITVQIMSSVETDFTNDQCSEEPGVVNVYLSTCSSGGTCILNYNNTNQLISYTPTVESHVYNDMYNGTSISFSGSVPTGSNQTLVEVINTTTSAVIYSQLKSPGAAFAASFYVTGGHSYSIVFTEQNCTYNLYCYNVDWEGYDIAWIDYNGDPQSIVGSSGIMDICAVEGSISGSATSVRGYLTITGGTIACTSDGDCAP